MMTSRMITWAAHVERMGEKRNTYRILMGWKTIRIEATAKTNR
jgi:hypothetical protein